MGTSLNNTKIKDTFQGLIKTTDNSTVGSSNKELTDGSGNDLNISVNNTGAITADGDITAANLIKSGGTSTQILLATGAVVTLTLESAGISSNDNDTSVPTNASVKDFVDTEIANLVDSSPAALDTLNELAAALGDDANFSTTVNTALGNRLRIDVNNQGLSAGEKTNALTNLGITATSAEINFIDGVTSNIQTQIDNLQSEINVSSTRIVAHSASAQTFTVTVAAKTSAHRYNGTGSSNGYLIDSTEAPYMTLTVGNTYRFDQSDSSNAGHPLLFYYEADKTTAYTSGVTTNGTAGSAGAYTQIIATESTPTVLHYQCSSHAYMGNLVNFDTRNLTGFDTGDLTEGTNLYFTNARADARIAAADTDDLSEGSTNLYFTNARADARISAASIDDLSDVDTTTSAPSTGQVLKWDGTNFTPQNDISGDSAPDVFQTVAVSGQSNIVADSSTDTLNFAAGDNITLTTNASTDTLTIASTASGGGFTVNTENFSGDGSDTTFDLSNTISDEDNTQVFIDGVYQSKTNYSTSGVTITFSTAPPSGTNNIEVVHYIMGGSQGCETDTFNGDNSTTAFTVTTEPSNENHLQVFIDGVYQSKTNYSVSGTTLTFTTAPPTGTNNVEVVNIKI